MTSSPDSPRRRDHDLPPGLASMWRLFRLGYRHEPPAAALRRRSVVGRGAAGRVDRAVAEVPGRGGHRPRPHSAGGRVRRPRRLGHRHLVAARRGHPGAAAVPRPGHHRARIPRRPPAGIGVHDRPPGAPRAPRPARRPARPGLRARPHVHVGVLDRRLDPAAGRDRRRCSSRSIRRWPCSSSSPHRRCSPRPGGPGSSGRPRNAEPRRTGWRGTSSSPRPRRRPARRCGSPASGPAWSWTAEPPGSAGSQSCPTPVGARPCGTPWGGRSSGSPTSRRWCWSPRDREPRPATSCSCLRRAHGCRGTSGRPSARSASCAGSGWTVPGAWRGWRTTRRPSRRTRTSRSLRCSRTASASRT